MLNVMKTDSVLVAFLVALALALMAEIVLPHHARATIRFDRLPAMADAGGHATSTRALNHR